MKDIIESCLTKNNVELESFINNSS